MEPAAASTVGMSRLRSTSKKDSLQNSLTVYVKSSSGIISSMTRLPDSPDPSDPQSTGLTRSFEEDCRTAVGSVRASILGLLRALDADPTRPQQLASRFKLDKSLTWKISRALQANDAFAAALALPGASGVGLLFDALKRKGGPAELIEQGRRAIDEFEQMVERHAGDRETMRVMLECLCGDQDALELGRRQAFRGASGIWGLQCQVRMVSQFIAPSESSEEMLDLMLVAGWIKFRRLRSIGRWPFMDVQQLDDNHAPNRRAARSQPLGDPADEGGWVLRQFCSGPMPSVHTRDIPGGFRLEFGDGPVGRTGEFNCFAGYLLRGAVPRYRSAGDERADVMSGIALPTDTHLLDLFVHTSMTEVVAPTLRHFARLPQDIDASDPSHQLPIVAAIHDLGRHPIVATPLASDYESIVAAALARAKWNLADFRCFRVVYRYPPTISTIVLSYPLPTRPEATPKAVVKTKSKADPKAELKSVPKGKSKLRAAASSVAARSAPSSRRPKR